MSNKKNLISQPKHVVGTQNMLNLLGKIIFTILARKSCLSLMGNQLSVPILSMVSSRRGAGGPDPHPAKSQVAICVLRNSGTALPRGVQFFTEGGL